MVESMDWQSVEIAYEANDWSDLRRVVDLVSTPTPSPASRSVPEFPGHALTAGSSLSTPLVGKLSRNPFTPSYPIFGDVRCENLVEIPLALAVSVLEIASTFKQRACHALPHPGQEACFAVALLVEAVSEALALVAKECEIQDGAVDSAEIEAAYENTFGLLDNLDEHHDELVQHDTDIKTAVTHHDTDIKMAVTQHDTDIKTAVTNHDTDIKMAVAQHDTDIKMAVTQHDIDIKTAIATHDFQIKARLTKLQAGVDANAQRLKATLALQRQIIRLLLTPDGQRAVNPAVLTCTGDDCPNVLDCPGSECSFPINPSSTRR